MDNLNKAKTLLQDHSLVLVKENDIYIEDDKGLKPLLSFINKNINLKGFSLADKIIGRAAAFLIIKLNIKEVYTKTISKGAYELLIDNNVDISYDNMVDKILNKDKTGLCPMEECVININNPEDAYNEIIKKIKLMKK